MSDQGSEPGRRASASHQGLGSEHPASGSLPPIVAAQSIALVYANQMHPVAIVLLMFTSFGFGVLVGMDLMAWLST